MGSIKEWIRTAEKDIYRKRETGDIPAVYVIWQEQNRCRPMYEDCYCTEYREILTGLTIELVKRDISFRVEPYKA